MSNKIVNTFSGGMNLDAVPSLQPDGTYRVLVNGQHESFDFNSFGIVNEPSNELCFSLPDGYDICGWGFIEERDQFVIFSVNRDTNVSQIGIGDTNTCEYKTLIEDKDSEKFLNKFCFSPSEKIVPQFKHLRPCNHLWMYWSSGMTYYRLNLDAEFCDIKYEDLVLFDCQCPSVISAQHIDDGGYLLEVGAYQFVCQLADDDQNKTNWFEISNPITLTSENNKTGEKSPQAVLLTIDRLPKSYPKVNIAVIKTVGGVQSAAVITTLYHNGKKISYTYRGKDKDDEPITTQEILSKKNGYIRGRDLIQRDGRLFLYNILEEWNLDAQRYANRISTSFIVGKMPAKYAGEVPTLPRGEVLSLAAVYNYCDGTSSLGFHIPGRSGSKDDFTKIPSGDPNNCTNCEKFKWELENTAYIEEDYCNNAYGISSAKIEDLYKEEFINETVIYKKINRETFVRCKSHPDVFADDEICVDQSNTGMECDECSSVMPPTADIVIGVVKCPDEEECVDGYCPSTGYPCKFCPSCGGTDYFLELKQQSYYKPDETNINPAAAEFEACPSGDVVYDDKGCNIIGYKPYKAAKGKFGFWQSSELYPKTKACDGSFLYGELAGTPIRHHVVPDESLVKFSVSKNNGVVGKDNIDNYEWLNTDVFVIGLELCGIELPPNPPKPYCPNNPISIYWQKVDPLERRVNARGLLTHTFKGNIRNKEYAVPKNAVNSLEYYDRHLEANQFTTVPKFRGGGSISLPVYNFHSPDTHFQKIPLTADRALIPYEVFGTGERYGIWAEGEEPVNMWHTTTNERGTRQNINLNKTDETGDVIVVDTNGKCKRPVVVTFTLDACDVNEEIYQTCVELGVDKSLVTSFTATLNALGNHPIKPVTQQNIICHRDLYAGPQVHVIVDWEVNFTLTENGVACKYHAGGVLKASHRKPGCTDSKSITVYSDDKEESTHKYTKGAKRCVKGISYADKDSIVDKGEKFTYSLLNLKRESSVYLELDGDVLHLNNNIDRYLTDGKYNGLGDLADETSDGSFLGDVSCENCPISISAGHHAILLNYSPNQYGRIESATYIPLGINLTADDVICGKIEKFGIGDSYVGLHSFRRMSFVTDKIGTIDDQLPPEIDRIGNSVLGIDLAVSVDRLLCRHDCSQLPPSCDLSETVDGVRYLDNRKNINLRDQYEFCWNPDKTPFAGYTGRDTYHGNTLNTVVHFWTESRINLWKLQNGDVEPYHFDFSKTYPVSNGSEVTYEKVVKNKSKLKLDSSIPDNTPWTFAWLNRIGVRWRTVALLKRIVITFIKLLIVIGIPLVLATAFGGGIVGTILAAVILGWLLFSDKMSLMICQWLWKLFTVRQCRPKCLGAGIHCYIPDDDTLPWEDNYYGYNWDFNTQNDLSTVIGMTDPYNTCICEVGEGNQIVYSAKQNPLSETDAYKNFLANNYISIPADYGKLKSLFSLNNNFFAQTSDMVLNIATADGLLNLGNGQLLEVITEGGELRSMPKALYSDIPEGYGGTLDPNASINTQFGRFSVDRKAKKIFLFSGQMKEISNAGIRNFLKENMELMLAKQFPDFKDVDEVNGVGYRLGFDHRFNKLLFTKKDYKARHPEDLSVRLGNSFMHKDGYAVQITDDVYFEDVSFTLSYDPTNNTWVSFHTYYPDGYAYDRDHMYTIKDGGFWKHGDTYGDFQMFYGKYHPHTIEFVIKQQDMAHSTFTDMEMEVDSSEFEGMGWINGAEKTFSDAMFYNDTNNTGKVSIVRKSKENAMDNLKQKDDEITIDWQKDNIRLNEIRNRVEDYDYAMFDKGRKDGLNILNEQVIGKRTKRFEGKYLVARLILDRPDDNNLQHLTKRVITGQDKTTR